MTESHGWGAAMEGWQRKCFGGSPLEGCRESAGQKGLVRKGRTKRVSDRVAFLSVPLGMRPTELGKWLKGGPVQKSWKDDRRSCPAKAEEMERSGESEERLEGLASLSVVQHCRLDESASLGGGVEGFF